MTIRLYLVDDHTIVREGLRAILQNEPDLKIVGEAGDGIGLLPKIEVTHPDVVVLDLIMPGPSGLEVTRQIQQQYPRTRVVILSMHDKPAYVAEALKNGASAYVLKGAVSRELIQAIRKAMEGEQYLSFAIDPQAIEAYTHTIQGQGGDPFETLTRREREIILLAVLGLSSAEIAARLVISRRTVETHRARAMQKLGLQTPSDLVRYAIKHGMEEIDDSLFE
jgi:two-component system, NarL family, response regulator NreC